MAMIDPHDLTVIFKITLAAVMAGLIGYEREHWRKPGGIRTYMLVGVGACVLTVISSEVVYQFGDYTRIDPTRLTAALITGIGFIGAGMIIHHGKQTLGLTTSAGIWVTAAVAIAIGYGYYLYAVYASLITFFSLLVVGYFSKAHPGEVEEDTSEKTKS